MSYIGSKPANKAVVASDLDPAVITGQTALAAEPADTDEFLISDAGTLKRLDASLIGGGKIIQIVNVTDGTTATGTTLVPPDNTIPQNTEGTEFMTLAITPTNASNKLLIQVVIVGSLNITNNATMTALFQDSTANALAATMQAARQADVANTTTFNHYMTAGTTSATTFKVRAGSYFSGTYRFNGMASSAAQLFGGVSSSSITITEIEA